LDGPLQHLSAVEGRRDDGHERRGSGVGNAIVHPGYLIS
jgi:hypothetical protein